LEVLVEKEKKDRIAVFLNCFWRILSQISIGFFTFIAYAIFSLLQQGAGTQKPIALSLSSLSLSQILTNTPSSNIQ